MSIAGDRLSNHRDVTDAIEQLCTALQLDFGRVSRICPSFKRFALAYSLYSHFEEDFALVVEAPAQNSLIQPPKNSAHRLLAMYGFVRQR